MITKKDIIILLSLFLIISITSCNKKLFYDINYNEKIVYLKNTKDIDLTNSYFILITDTSEIIFGNLYTKIYKHINITEQFKNLRVLSSGNDSNLSSVLYLPELDKYKFNFSDKIKYLILNLELEKGKIIHLLVDIKREKISKFEYKINN